MTTQGGHLLYFHPFPFSPALQTSSTHNHTQSLKLIRKRNTPVKMAKNIDNSVKEKNDQYAHEEVGIQP